jgi:hypothetical protein
MIKPLIPSTEEVQPELSFSQKMTQKAMNLYAKILGNKKFEKNPLQEYDGQIVHLVQESYLPPAERQKIIGDRKLDDELNFPLHNVYAHLDQKKMLICYRGTDFTDIKDVVSDIQIVLGVNAIDVRVKESLDFYDQAITKYATYEKWLTGHSLGGTIAYIVSKHRIPDRCIAFNPGSAPTKSFLSMMQDTLLKKEWTQKITTYKIFGDIVSTLSFVGNVKTFFLKTVDPKKLHSINSFPGLFEGKEKE